MIMGDYEMAVTTQMSINRWTDEQVVQDVTRLNKVLLSHQKEWSTDTRYNIDEVQKHAKWK